ncbi:MAG: hypothetical protein C0487_05910 [Leptothrix sp. (in: Bacteria)]|nr:hypothetical protein [Leptothrix sp. (in: b-proteobacteria)]
MFTIMTHSYQHSSSPRPAPTRPRQRPQPLSDDQYLASSLALVAQLSRRVRGAPSARRAERTS